MNENQEDKHEENINQNEVELTPGYEFSEEVPWSGDSAEFCACGHSPADETCEICGAPMCYRCCTSRGCVCADVAGQHASLLKARAEAGGGAR